MRSHNCVLLRHYDPRVHKLLRSEERRQRDGIELIPSENHAWPEVLCALGSVLSNICSDGYLGRGEFRDRRNAEALEELARERACRLFGCGHAAVGSLFGPALVQAVLLGLVKPGAAILAMAPHGVLAGHESPASRLGRVFEFVHYAPDPADGSIDHDEVRRLARKHRPGLILCHDPAYPRDPDYAAFRAIADEVEALTLADVSHCAGLIAGKVMANPFDHGIDVMVTSAHESLRGPRGGIVLCTSELARTVDESLAPEGRDVRYMNAVAGMAIALKKALDGGFEEYARDVVANARALEAVLREAGIPLLFGGTDCHMLVPDVRTGVGLDGRSAEELLDKVCISVGRQPLAGDADPHDSPGGIRLGTFAVTTRGMVPEHMERIADWMLDVLRHAEDPEKRYAIRAEVEAFCREFPVPGVEEEP